ncbi:MAG: UvrD-helicase domain-containing protein [Brevinema sp.]
MITKANLTSEQVDILAFMKTENRMIVSAPPGCGKTTLILFLLEQWQELKEIGPYKSTLILSFSTSASSKLKLELQEEKSFPSENIRSMQYVLKEKTFTTNYHGLCRRILFKQRKLLLELIKSTVPKNPSEYENIENSLNNIQKLSGVAEPQYNKVTKTSEVLMFLTKMDNNIKNIKNVKNLEDIKDGIQLYSEHMIRYFLPRGVISFNGIIILVLWLFIEKPKLRENYQHYFTHIIVDEYQDTNILGYYLLFLLVGENTKFYAFGDELQQLYRFIGAIPKLFEISKQKFNCTEKKLTINQRYKDNPKMLKISEYIRSVAEGSAIDVPEDLKLDRISNFEEVSEYFQDKYKNNTCCIMFQNRYMDHGLFLNSFNQQGIKVFYAMFGEDGYSAEFHVNALETWQSYDSGDHTIISLLSKLIKHMKTLQTDCNKNEWESLLVLLELLKNSFNSTGEWAFLEDYEQFQIVKDILSNKTLKQFLDKVTGKVIMSTIHAAKGQQWGYTVTKFCNETISDYSSHQNISLINVGLSRASIEAKVFVTEQQMDFPFIGTILKEKP